MGNFINQLKKLEKISMKYNIINQIFKIENSKIISPNFNLFYGRVNLKNSNENEIFASSIDENKTFSLIKLFSEALERYLLSNYDLNKLKYCKYSEINVSLEIIKKFINHKKIKLNDIKKNYFYWTECFDEFNSKKIFLPSQLIFVPFNHDKIYFIETISTGASIRNSKRESIFYGVCEVLERHYMMKLYLEKIEPYRINNLREEKIKNIINIIEKNNVKIHIFKINPEISFSVIMCIIEDLNKNSPLNPAIAIGTSCDFEELNAIKNSILEAYKTRIGMIQTLNLNKDKLNKKIKVNNIIERILFWSNEKNTHKLNFILKTKKIINFNYKKISFIEKEKKLMNFLRKNNYNLYIYNLGNKYLENHNIYSYKSIIPEMQPLYLYEESDCKIGPLIKKEYKDLNKVPHPFL